MEALPIVKAILAADAGVTAERSGGIHINEARQRDPLPNVVLMSVGSNGDSDDLSHQGPNGLLIERVRVYARAKTAQEAGELGIAIDKALQGFTGMVSGAHVQLVSKMLTMGDFHDGATAQRAILEFRVHWTRAA